MGRGRRLVIPGLAAMAISAVLAYAVTTHLGGNRGSLGADGSAQRVSYPAAPIPAGGEFEPGADILRDGQAATLQAAESAMSFHVLLPNAAAGSPSTMTSVFAGPVGSNAMEMCFASGLTIVEEQVVATPPFASVAAEFSAAGADAAVATVHGVQALEIAENAADMEGVGPEHNPGSITFVLGDVQVSLTGFLPLSDMEAVANSMS